MPLFVLKETKTRKGGPFFLFGTEMAEIGNFGTGPFKLHLRASCAKFAPRTPPSCPVFFFYSEPASMITWSRAQANSPRDPLESSIASLPRLCRTGTFGHVLRGYPDYYDAERAHWATVFCDSDSDAKDAVAKLHARLSSTLNHLDVVARTWHRAVIVLQVRVKSVFLTIFCFCKNK